MISGCGSGSCVTGEASMGGVVVATAVFNGTGFARSPSGSISGIEADTVGHCAATRTAGVGSIGVPIALLFGS